MLTWFVLSSAVVVVNGVARTLIKHTHVKGRLLDQAVIFFNCVPFQNGSFYKRKEFALQRERILSFKSNSLWYGKSLLPH